MLDIDLSIIEASKKPIALWRSIVSPKIDLAIFLKKNVLPNSLFDIEIVENILSH